MNFLGELTIGIPGLPWLWSMAKSVSSTVELVSSVTSDTVNSFNFAMCADACKCLPIELVPCSDGWWRTWWQMIHMMSGLLVSSIPWCKLNRHEGASLKLSQATGRFEPIFIEGNQASKMICKVRSLTSWIKTHSFVEYIITSSNEVFKDFVSGIAVGILTLSNSTWITVKRCVIVR